jgi:hypothetical protein
MASRTVEWILSEDSVSPEHRDALGRAVLAVVDFLAAYALGDQTCPLALTECLEAVRTDDVEADDLRHVAVVAKEVLRPRGGDVTAG